jgi:phage terminase large subunit
MCSGFDDWIYWHFFKIAVDYKSSHTELLLNDVCLTKATFRQDTRWLATSVWDTASRRHNTLT